MPKPGEVRKGTTETVQWDGQRWNPIEAQADTNVPMHHPSAREGPWEARFDEVGRTAKEAGIGLLRSPLDLVKGLIGAPKQILEGYGQLPELIADPTLLGELPDAIASGVKSLGDNPRDAGSLLGQMLIAPKVPDAANVAVAKGPGVVGRGVGKVGRGLEAAGTAVTEHGMTPAAVLSAGTLAYGHPVAAATAFAAPYAAKYSGRGLQKLGSSIEGLKLASKPKAPVVPDTNLSGMTLSPEAVARNIEATNLRDVSGFSHTQAGKLAGIPSAGKASVSDVPMGKYAITDKMVTGLGKAKPKAVTPEAVAAPEPSMRGLEDAVSPGQMTNAMRDEAVRRFLSASPDSVLNRSVGVR